MKITLKQIKKLDPCRSRLDHFVRHYPNFKGSLEDFLMLENITYGDKVWVCVRLMTRNQKFFWARSTAYSVLEIFEARRPNDTRVRELFDYLNTIDDVENLSAEQLTEIRRLRDAAADAAYAVDADAAYAAAAAGAYAAAAVAVAAAYAGAYAVAAYAYASNGRLDQEQFNLIILKSIMDMDI